MNDLRGAQSRFGIPEKSQNHRMFGVGRDLCEAESGEGEAPQEDAFLVKSPVEGAVREDLL